VARHRRLDRLTCSSPGGSRRWNGSRMTRVEQIGSATLYLGDAMELLRADAFGKIGAIVSDPPYGIGYLHSGHQTTLATGTRVAATVSRIHGDSQPFDPSPWIDFAPRHLKTGVANADAPRICLWGADHFRARLPEYGTLLAWDKNVGFGGDDSFADCEWAWCGRSVKREVFRWLWKGGISRNKSNPLDFLTSAKKRLHVSQKPVELMRWSIEKARPLAGLPVLDPYMGSGSTGVAAVSLGLPFVGCEIDPEIFDLAVRRIRLSFGERGA